ncbi:hypothetical protein [Thauera sp.]
MATPYLPEFLFFQIARRPCHAGTGDPAKLDLSTAFLLQPP